MIAELLTEPDDRLAPNHTRHLSYSRINRYLTCPRQYELYYLVGLRPKCPSANLVFGQTVHQALAQFFTKREEPVSYFLEAWRAVQETELTYGARDSWDRLRLVGAGLIEKFVNEEAPKLANIQAVEQPFDLSITSLDLPLVGIIDLVADLEGKRTVIDFKTAATDYEPHEVELSDQLTSYQLARPEAERLAFCVLIKTKAPKIEWHLTSRTGEQLTEFLAKAEIVGSDIADGRFFKRPGKHCAWCDYLPVCLNDRKCANETLVQIG